MTMAVSEIASAILGALTSGLTGLVSAIPTAIKDTFTNLFFSGTGSTQTVSPMVIVLLVFGGVSLAFGLSKLVWHLVTKRI